MTDNAFDFETIVVNRGDATEHYVQTKVRGRMVMEYGPIYGHKEALEIRDAVHKSCLAALAELGAKVKAAGSC